MLVFTYCYVCVIVLMKFKSINFCLMLFKMKTMVVWFVQGVRLDGHLYFRRRFSRPFWNQIWKKLYTYLPVNQLTGRFAVAKFFFKHVGFRACPGIPNVYQVSKLGIIYNNLQVKWTSSLGKECMHLISTITMGRWYCVKLQVEPSSN